jgi:hypothetical protein
LPTSLHQQPFFDHLLPDHVYKCGQAQTSAFLAQYLLALQYNIIVCICTTTNNKQDNKENREVYIAHLDIGKAQLR